MRWTEKPSDNQPGAIYVYNPNYNRPSIWKRLLRLFRRPNNTSILESSDHTLKSK